MNRVYSYLSTIVKLGIGQVAFVAWYRLTVKTGLRQRWFPQVRFENDADFFRESELTIGYPKAWKKQVVRDADKIVKGQIRYYARHWKELGCPPGWFLNPFNGAEYPNVQGHWTNLADFNPAVGDIKNVWEASRFEWVTTLARAYAVSREQGYLSTLNLYLSDWKKNNPLNTGPHWKCGQEASIRLFNLLNAAFILNQHTHPSPAMLEFVTCSLHRIAGNIRYAIAQDNNHGTSEATALLIGGLWLQQAGVGSMQTGIQLARQGRRWLENRVNKLISASGSFSQHSVTYHRVLLDTLSFAEFWRKRLGGAPFSEQFYKKAKAATNWLYQLTDSISGDVPNLGSNDGALLLNTHSCGYRDFRPSLQLAAHLFYHARWFDDGCHNEPLFWFSLDERVNLNAPLKKSFSAHGYATLHGKDSWALIKWPYYRFRPSHNDVLHMDLWHNGKNVVCDSGTYSYNPDSAFQMDLKSVHAHNTVNFDHREQMPKLGRFLMGDWLRAETAALQSNGQAGNSSWMGSYRDSFGNQHQRKVEWTDHGWIITDTLSGDFKKAVIGFNLNDQTSLLEHDRLKAKEMELICPPDVQINLKDCLVSRHYWEKDGMKRLELEINEPGEYTTRIILWNS